MKGVPGLLLAIGLGIGGAFASWFYIAQKSRELDQIDFVAVAHDKDINADHKFEKSDFMPVSIPRRNVGSLDRVALMWKDLETILGQHARKSYAPGEIILHQDLSTAPEADVLKKLGDKEDLISVPIDTRTIVPALINPGTMVSLIIPKLGRTPTPADRAGPPSAATEVIGPFRIVALGNRLGTAAAMKSMNIVPVQENVMSIAVTRVNGQFDEKTQKLVDALRLSNAQQLQVIIHKNTDSKKK